MFDVLSSILDTIITLVTFLINTINSLIVLIINIPTYISLLVNSINILPSFLIPFILAFISLVVIQYILNRRAV